MCTVCSSLYVVQWARAREREKNYTRISIWSPAQHTARWCWVPRNNYVMNACVYMALSIYKTEWFWNFNNSSFWTFRAHSIVQVIKIMFVVSVRMATTKISLPSFSLPLAPRNFVLVPFICDLWLTLMQSLQRCYLPDPTINQRPIASSTIIYLFKMLNACVCTWKFVRQFLFW